MTTTLCNKCNTEIGSCAFKRHFNFCTGLGKRKYKKYERIGDKSKCPICEKLFPHNGVQTHYRMVHQPLLTTICNKCDKQISSYVFNKHFINCGIVTKKQNRKWERVGDKSKCPICEKLFNPIGVQAHYRIVHENNSISTTIPWNKGLTKETDSRVLLNANNTAKSMKKLYTSGYKTTTQTQEYWTAERRKQKSEWRKQIIVDKPETHPNRLVAGNRSKMTYPEKVAYDWFSKNKIKVEHQKPILTYFVDFCIDKIIVEIDGERWHPIGNEKDTARDAILNSLGYCVYRIRSKERIEEKLKMIFGV